MIDVDILKHPIRGQSEDKLLYPEEPLCNYTRSKMLAEKVPFRSPRFCLYRISHNVAVQLILASNGYSGVLTAAIRPNGIYGPRDAVLLIILFAGDRGALTRLGLLQLLGKVAATGAQGIGMIGRKQDYVYIENLVHGFLCLEAKLVPGSSVAGKVVPSRLLY